MTTNEVLNNGKLIVYYLGDGPGDKNYPDVNPLRDAKIYKNETNDFILNFEIDYPQFPHTGTVDFNLTTYTCQYEDLLAYGLHVIELNEDEFIIILYYALATTSDTENFEGIARFKGKIPNGMNFQKCPATV